MAATVRSDPELEQHTATAAAGNLCWRVPGVLTAERDSGVAKSDNIASFSGVTPEGVLAFEDDADVVDIDLAIVRLRGAHTSAPVQPEKSVIRLHNRAVVPTDPNCALGVIRASVRGPSMVIRRHYHCHSCLYAPSVVPSPDAPDTPGSQSSPSTFSQFSFSNVFNNGTRSATGSLSTDKGKGILIPPPQAFVNSRRSSNDDIIPSRRSSANSGQSSAFGRGGSERLDPPVPPIHRRQPSESGSEITELPRTLLVIQHDRRPMTQSPVMSSAGMTKTTSYVWCVLVCYPLLSSL